MAPFPADLPDCEICHGLWQRLNDTVSLIADKNERFRLSRENQILLGSSFNDALSSPCPGHASVLNMFKDFVVSMYDRQGAGFTTVPCGSPLEDPCTYGRIVLRDDELWHWGSLGDTTCGLQLINRSDVPGHGGTARLLDAKWIDVSLLKQWKDECDADHGPACLNPMKAQRVRPAWLVDVQDKCLVRGEVEGTYVALSYTWGTQLTHLAVDASLHAQLREPGSLDNKAIIADMPPTVLDAMYLTSAIGERYLWVDMLCIVFMSGHTEETSRELERMGAIYASSVVTIVAADGTSSDGLRGLRDGPSKKPRKLRQVPIPFGSMERIVQRNYTKTNLDVVKPYSERGWTFQEFILSPRKIIFGGREAHWQCHRAIIHETGAGGYREDGLDEWHYGQVLNVIAGFPNTDVLNNIMMFYNDERNFKYDEDALPGILGLLSLLSRPFGGFIYGIPINMFDGCLNWTPANHRADLSRRKESDRPVEAKLHPSGLPSWSWVGWKGPFVLGTRHSTGPKDPGGGFIDESSPVTDWWAGDTPNWPRAADQPLFKINSTWHETTTKYKDFSKPLPAGWTRHEVLQERKQMEMPYLCPEGCDKFVFTHESSPHQEWSFPFPINEAGSDLPISIPQLRYLFCKTKRAFLIPIKRQLFRDTMGSDFYADDITNVIALAPPELTDQIIGALHLHDGEQAAEFDKADGSVAANKKIELVAINKTRRYSKPEKDGVVQKDGKIHVSDRYGVLWIEWQEGVAYRCASGWVYQEDWDQLALEKIDLVLG
jgi:hypothetical protein